MEKHDGNVNILEMTHKKSLRNRSVKNVRLPHSRMEMEKQSKLQTTMKILRWNIDKKATFKIVSWWKISWSPAIHCLAFFLMELSSRWFKSTSYFTSYSQVLQFQKQQLETHWYQTEIRSPSQRVSALIHPAALLGKFLSVYQRSLLWGSLTPTALSCWLIFNGTLNYPVLTSRPLHTY